MILIIFVLLIVMLRVLFIKRRTRLQKIYWCRIKELENDRKRMILKRAIDTQKKINSEKFE